MTEQAEYYQNLRKDFTKAGLYKGIAEKDITQHMYNHFCAGIIHTIAKILSLEEDDSELTHALELMIELASINPEFNKSKNLDTYSMNINMIKGLKGIIHPIIYEGEIYKDLSSEDICVIKVDKDNILSHDIMVLFGSSCLDVYYANFGKPKL